jgi:DNA-binding GntR family transcriptional regulator
MNKNRNARERTDNSPMRDKVYRWVQRKILAGELRGGDVISELSLSNELGISRTPVREALGQLVAEGLLQQSPNRRPAVVKLTRQDIIELYELREALEVYAVGKAARNQVPPADLQRLQGLADQTLAISAELERLGKEVLDVDQMHRFGAYDRAFHTLLMKIAANAKILKAVNETRVMIQIFAMRRQGHDVPTLQRIHREHCEVLRAVAEKRPERAMQTIAEHIQNSLKERLDEYDQTELEASLQEHLSHPAAQFTRRPIQG